MNRMFERIAKLEAARPASRPRSVRTHVVDCAPEDREARMAAIHAAEPDALHILRAIIDPAERKAAQ
jgi:hypothetical protein